MSEAEPKQIPVQQEVTPEVLEKCRSIFDAWEKGDITFQVALDQYSELRQTLSGCLVDVGQIEIQLGVMQGHRSNYDESIGHFEKAREIFIEVGNRRMLANCTLNLGEVYRLRGNFTRARQYFFMSYKAAMEGGFKTVQVAARVNESRVLLSLKNYDQAATILKECYELAQNPWEDPEPKHIANRRAERLCEISYALAKVLLEMQKIDEAWETAAQCLKYSKAHNTPLVLGLANRIVGEVLTARETPPSDTENDPDVYFQESSKVLREIKADGEVAHTLLAHGKSLGKRGKKHMGARKIQQATLLFTKLGMLDDAAQAAQAQIELM